MEQDNEQHSFSHLCLLKFFRRFFTMKKLSSIILSLIMMISISVPAMAAEVPEEKTPVTLYTTNCETTETDHGFIVTMDLVQKSETDERLVVPVGIAKFDIRINSSNTGGEGRWEVTLSNDDFVKGVDGEMVVKQDWIGPYNPVSARMYVDEYYSYGTLYKTARGVEYFYFDDNEVFDDSKNIIFQWRDFKVTGVTDDYWIRNGEKQGEIGDF